jgi:hypothetical protein
MPTVIVKSNPLMAMVTQASSVMAEYYAEMFQDRYFALQS